MAALEPLSRVVLIEPLIPENTGSVGRTCVGTRSELHVVGPLGFEITESRVKRAGLDYWEHLSWREHQSTQDWLASVADPSRIFLIETGSPRSIYEAKFLPGDWLVFGKETSGLSMELREKFNSQLYSIPMPGPTRSFNLSNAVAVCVFELLRQTQTS